MAKATKRLQTIVLGVTLELSVDEARALKALVGMQPFGGWAQSLYNALDGVVDDNQGR